MEKKNLVALEHKELVQALKSKDLDKLGPLFKELGIISAILNDAGTVALVEMRTPETRSDPSALSPPSSSSTPTSATTNPQSSSVMNPEIAAQEAEIKKLEKDLEENSNEIKETNDEIKKLSKKIEKFEPSELEGKLNEQQQNALNGWREKEKDLRKALEQLREEKIKLLDEKKRLNEKLDKAKEEAGRDLKRARLELTLETLETLFPKTGERVYEEGKVFVGREKEIGYGLIYINKNCFVNSPGEAVKFVYPVCAGLPGIGKTTLICKIADEYRTKHEKEHPDHLVKIGLLNLLNGGKFLVDGVTEAEVMLRVLSAYFTPDFVAAKVPNQLRDYPEATTLDGVLKLIEKDCQKKGKKKVIFMLIFDEFQELIPVTALAPKEKVKTLRDICSYLNGEFLNQGKPVWIQPMFAGTLDPVFFPQVSTGLPIFENLQPMLLSSKEIFDVVDEYKRRAKLPNPKSLDSEWRLNQRFVIDLLDLGSIPRVLNTFLENCFGSRLANSAILFFQNARTFKPHHAVELTTNAIRKWYGFEDVKIEDRNKSILYSVTGLRLPDDDKNRLEIVSTRGFLLIFGDFRNPIAEMSHYLLRSFVNDFPVSFPNFAHYFTSLDFSPTSWEQFNVEYLAFRINALVFLKETEVTLERLFQGAWGADGTRKLKVKLKEVQAVQSITQITSERLDARALSLNRATSFVVSKGSEVVQNAGGAPYADGLLSLELASGEGHVLLALQEKLTVNAEGLDEKTIEAEIKKNKAEGRRVITVFLSNRPPKIDKPPRIDKPLPEDCLVICKSNLKEYYGCFKDVPLLHLAGSSVMINYSNVKQVQELARVGEAISEKIVKAVPIKNAEMLRSIVGDKVNIDEVSYFPYDI